MSAASELPTVAKRLRALAARRDQLVCEASAEGLSLRAIAALAGLSHAGVQRILDRTEQARTGMKSQSPNPKPTTRR